MALRSEAHAFEQSLTAWADGVRSELRFWRKFLRAAADGKLPGYLDRIRPDYPVFSGLSGFVRGSQCRILDVGAGALTACGTRLEGCTVALVPVDPLATFYTKICEDVGITPLIPTQFGFAEDLSAQFPEGSFDIALSVNALDHCIDPIAAITEMLIVTKTGGTVYLDHEQNEGSSQDYSGMHQWNFSQEGRDFIIWNRDTRTNVTQSLAHCADVASALKHDRIQVYIVKRSNPVADMAELHRSRRGIYLEAFLHYIAATQLPPPFGAPSVRRRAFKTLIRLR